MQVKRYKFVYLALILALVMSFIVPQNWLDEHEIILLLLIGVPIGLLTILADIRKNST